MNHRVPLCCCLKYFTELSMQTRHQAFSIDETVRATAEKSWAKIILEKSCYCETAIENRVGTIVQLSADDHRTKRFKTVNVESLVPKEEAEQPLAVEEIQAMSEILPVEVEAERSILRKPTFTKLTVYEAKSTVIKEPKIVGCKTTIPSESGKNKVVKSVQVVPAKSSAGKSTGSKHATPQPPVNAISESESAETSEIPKKQATESAAPKPKPPKKIPAPLVTDAAGEIIVTISNVQDVPSGVGMPFLRNLKATKPEALNKLSSNPWCLPP